MNLDTARNGTQTKCKMCNPAVWVPIFRKHRVSHLVHNNGNVIWFHLHASIRSTLEFIRLTMLTPLDFSAGGVARIADWPLPFLVLQFRFWLSFPWREFVVVLEASAVTTWAASASSQRRLWPGPCGGGQTFAFIVWLGTAHKNDLVHAAVWPYIVSFVTLTLFVQSLII